MVTLPNLQRLGLAEDSSGDIWFGCVRWCAAGTGSSISHYMRRADAIDHPSGVRRSSAC